jgi:hypothetical protein
MKKIILIFAFITLCVSIKAQWITNGESGTSVRTKLNALKLTVDSMKVGTTSPGLSYNSHVITVSDTTAQMLLGKLTYPYNTKFYVWKSNNIAISGESSTGAGVAGTSVSNHGLYGVSKTGNGIYAQSDSLYGVSGYSHKDNGIKGESVHGNGVYGISSLSYAGYFDGKAKVKDSIITPRLNAKKIGVIPTDTSGVGSTANIGMIMYYNGNFYGLKAGSPPTWVQLNN